MATYEVTDPETGQKFRLTGDSPPTEQELEEIFGRQSRSLPQELGRQAGLTARAGLEGVSALAEPFANALAAGANIALDATGVEFRFPDQSGLADFIGLPKPEGATERIVQEGAQFLAGGGGIGAAGRGLSKATSRTAQGVGQSLTAAPRTQAAAATAGGTASQVAEEAGAGPGGQAVAGLAGAIGVSGVGQAVRGAVRGRGTETIRENITAFERAGTTPTLAQATQGRIAQATESLLSRTPGSAGVMARKAAGIADDLSETVQRRADSLVPKSTAERAGLEIRRGIGGFVDRFRARAGSLYDEVDEHINTDGIVPLTKTSRFFSRPSDLEQGAPATAQKLSSKFLDDLGAALNEDIRGALQATGVNGLPYKTVKAIRTAVGERLGNMTLIDDVSKGQLKQLYGALSDDMTEAARQAGPEALRATNRANAFYAAGRSRIDNLERVINKKGGPEKIFNAAIAGTKEGATTLRTVMKSLKPEERKFVTAAVVRRMGKATPGQQDETGELFSMQTFLTNWAKLSPEARGTLFAGLGKQFNDDMNALSKVAANIREGSKVFANPSGTQPASAQIAAASGAVFSLITGNLGAFGAIAGTSALANLTARMMTSPTVVNWLARSARAGAVTPAMINTLAQSAAGAEDRDAAEFAALLQEHIGQEDSAENQ